MNNLIEDHKKQKENNSILSGSMIDMHAFVKLAPQVFNENATTSPNFDNACDCLRDICREIRENMTKIEEIIPVKKVNELS